MDLRHTTTIEAVLEHLIANGATDLGRVFGQLFEFAMQIEREQYLKAGHYERTPEGYANGYKRIDTPAVTIQVPKTAGHEDDPFYPQSLERGQRSSRAVAVAEMYIKGVSTRQDVIMREFGIESLSSSQVSRATKLLDEELAAQPAPWADEIPGCAL